MDILDLSRQAAKIIKSKKVLQGGVEYDELVNVGYCWLKQRLPKLQNERQARSEAYYTMMGYLRDTASFWQKPLEYEPKRMRHLRRRPQDNTAALLDLEDAWRALDRRDKDVLLDYYVEGMPYKRVAERQGRTNPGSGWQMVNRALKRLREGMETCVN